MTAERPSRSTAVRAVVALVLTAAVAFAAVGAAADLAAMRIARDDALHEAVRTAYGVSQAVFASELPAAVEGNRRAGADLSAAVASRREDGTLTRVKVWRRDGTVLWSDDAAVVGRRYPVKAAMIPVFDRNRDHAGISALTDADNADERAGVGRLVEVYIPFVLDGSTLTMEMYFSAVRVLVAEHELGEQIVPLTLLALLVLALAQLPVSVWLVRRISAAQQDRERMLETVLVSSERERRLLAGNLHDGVVQELSGAAQLLDQRLPDIAVPEHRRQLGLVAHVLHRSVGDLREMLLELHPSELTGDNLAELIAGSAARTGPDLEVTVTNRIERPLSPELAAFLYRCARECVTNAAKHAAATRVGIVLTADADEVRLDVHDDGVGIPAGALSPRDGHLGLTLLQDAARDLGGSLRAHGDATGTVVTIAVPAGPD
ncbi:MAG TPA: ATP-binding protein [Mycobacteriales bacterium]|nr:ATP-binding protein [Mycobacteriales bacterium]